MTPPGEVNILNAAFFTSHSRTRPGLQNLFPFLYFFDYHTFFAGSHFSSNQELSRGLSIHKELPLKSLMASSIISTVGALAIRLIRKSISSRLPKTPWTSWSWSWSCLVVVMVMIRIRLKIIVLPPPVTKETNKTYCVILERFHSFSPLFSVLLLLLTSFDSLLVTTFHDP